MKYWTVRTLSLPVLVLVMLGCAPRQIVYPGTSEYESRVRTFTIAPDAARALAGSPYGSFGPAALIDREYLFSTPYKYSRVDLYGVYVNGDTGEVMRRHSSKSLTGNGLTMLLGFPHGMPTQVPEAAFDDPRKELPR